MTVNTFPQPFEFLWTNVVQNIRTYFPIPNMEFSKLVVPLSSALKKNEMKERHRNCRKRPLPPEY